MSNSAPSAGVLSWENARWVVGALVIGMCALIAYIFTNFAGDISELKQISRETNKEIATARVETIRAINAVERQAGETNVRLDALIDEMRRTRR